MKIKFKLIDQDGKQFIKQYLMIPAMQNLITYDAESQCYLVRADGETFSCFAGFPEEMTSEFFTTYYKLCPQWQENTSAKSIYESLLAKKRLVV